MANSASSIHTPYTFPFSIYPPAVFGKDSDRFGIDGSVIENRALIISIISGVGTALACLCSAELVSFCAFGMLVGRLTYIFIERLEAWRADRVVRNLALEWFRKNSTEVHASAIEYMMSSPEAVKELLKTPDHLNKKHDGTGLNFLQFLIEKENEPKNYIEQRKPDYYKKLANQTQVKKLLICHHFKNQTANQEMINHVLEKPDLLLLLFQQNLLSPNQLNANQKFLIWKHYNRNLAKLLKEKGFDPNQRNESGLTPILSAINEKDLDRILFLIQHGADIPPNDEALKQKRATDSGQEEYEIPLSEFLKDQPQILEVLEKGRKRELKFPTALKKNSPTFFSREPLISLYGSSIDVSEFAINYRTALLAIPVIFALGASIAATDISILSCGIAVIGGLSLWAYRKWEFSRATAKADTIALEELNCFPATRRSIDYLSSRKEVLLDLLKTNPQVFLTPNYDLRRCRSTLLTKLMQPKSSVFQEQLSLQDRIDIFTQAINKIFETIDEDKKFEIFLTTLKHNFCVEHFLRNHKIQWDQLTAEQQNQCWQNLKDSKLISLFIEKGFKPDHYFAFDPNDEGSKRLLLQRLRTQDYGFLNSLLSQGKIVVANEMVPLFEQHPNTVENQAKLRLLRERQQFPLSDFP